MLADSPELLSFRSQIDSDHQFNIGSPFLRAGLTRIADESIAPGLDSDFMVRSLLYAICGEVRHETQGKAATEEPDSALSPGQMQRLTEMLHRSEEHKSELQSLMRHSYAVFCLTKKKKNQH